ncbi:cytochrome P450 [Calocera cornea HHB12733]|uniref:Cytochrome P450 n=1 Tax=Calocera cornea HHB12733 TaxID=1353952 RepID=A0A165EZ66_9BASI|nr:cytochrome P450 [Calocera cornea HHB12733]
MMPSVSLLVLVVLALLVVYRVLRPSRLPPGPPGLPLLGNVLDIPLKGLFLKLDEWKRTNGGVFSLSAPGQKIVVLADAKSAADVLDKMSAPTSGRPRYIMMNEIMAGNLTITGIPANERWKRCRRIIHEGFNARASEGYAAIQEEESGRLCRYLLQNPGCDLYPALERTSCGVILRALYDAPSLFTSPTGEEKVQKLAEQMDAFMKAAMPLAYMVEMFPVLKYLPRWMAPFKAYGEDFFKDSNAYLENLYQEGCSTKQEGGKAKGFAVASEEARDHFGVTTQEAAWVSGVLYAAGSETSAAAVQSLCMAMLLYPEVQKKAKAEIDAVLGPHAPTLADRPNMPYMHAIVKETLRWRPPLPTGFPHLATENVDYGDYTIPKGTIVIGSIWSINHDAPTFGDPSVFRPERFLSSDGKTLSTPLSNYHDDDIAYGHGRRLCPGRYFANNMLFVEMTYLLWAFDILHAKDEYGRTIDPPNCQFVDRGLTCRPADFPCVFQPRQSTLADVLPPI